jgi:hypothetical protein
MLSNLRQMTEVCEKKQGLSLPRKQERIEVVVDRNLPIKIVAVLVFYSIFRCWDDQM